MMQTVHTPAYKSSLVRDLVSGIQSIDFFLKDNLLSPQVNISERRQAELSEMFDLTTSWTIAERISP